MPDPSSSWIITEWGFPCINSSSVEKDNCSTMVSGGSRLDVTTQDPRAHGSGDRRFRLFNWAPVLPGGFALIGEQAKFVHVSPQRYTSGQPAEPSRFGSLISTRELISNDNSTMAFGVVGSRGELVMTTVLLPMPTGSAVVVLPVTIGAGGITHVVCTRSRGCEWD